MVLCLFSNYCLSFFLLTESACMPRRLLSEREGKKGGGLTDPFMNLERDVELEAAWGDAGHLCLRRSGFRRRGWRGGFIYEAFFGMEPCVDFLRWIFTGRALSEGRLLRIMLVEGSTPTAAQVGQLIKFDEISSSHGGHTPVAVSLPRSCLNCMRRSGAPCSSTEHLWVRRP